MASLNAAAVLAAAFMGWFFVLFFTVHISTACLGLFSFPFLVHHVVTMMCGATKYSTIIW